MKTFASKSDHIRVGQIQRLLALRANPHLYASFVRGILPRNESIDTLSAKQSGNWASASETGLSPSSWLHQTMEYALRFNTMVDKVGALE
jgi:hypothetical protein